MKLQTIAKLLADLERECPGVVRASMLPIKLGDNAGLLVELIAKIDDQRFTATRQSNCVTWETLPDEAADVMKNEMLGCIRYNARLAQLKKLGLPADTMRIAVLARTSEHFKLFCEKRGLPPQRVIRIDKYASNIRGLNDILIYDVLMHECAEDCECGYAQASYYISSLPWEKLGLYVIETTLEPDSAEIQAKSLWLERQVMPAQA